MRKTFFMTGLLLQVFCCFQTIEAQNYMNVLNLKYYYLPQAIQSTEKYKVDFNEFRIEAAVPFELNSRTTLGIKPQYKYISLQSPDTSLNNLQIHSVKFPLFGYFKFKNQKWSTYIEAWGKLNSDFENITGNHFQYGTMMLFYYQMRPKLMWQFGIFYNQDTYGPYIMPLIGAEWKINPDNYLSVLLPATIIYERKLWPKLYCGVEMELWGETYLLGGAVSENSYISQEGENQFGFLMESRLFIDYYIAKHLVVYAKPGIRSMQMYEHFNEDDELIANSEYTQGKLDPSFYIEVGVAYRFRYDEEKEPKSEE